MNPLRPRLSRRRRRRSGAFLLLEVVVAVAIFTLGVLALGRCMSNCLDTQNVIAQEERARLALENAMVEVQANPSLPSERNTKTLDGMFQGITIIETRRTLDLKNEKNIAMPDLHEITLTARWSSRLGGVQSRSVIFNLLRGRG
jgi:type II secretory pathway component PulJ